jgi:UDP-apiose/xylose synthase
VFAARAVPSSASGARFRDVTAEELYGPGYDDTQERIPDIAKACALLSWRPATTIAQMLPAIVDDYVTRYAPLVAAEANDPRRPRRAQGGGA